MKTTSVFFCRNGAAGSAAKSIPAGSFRVVTTGMLVAGLCAGLWLAPAAVHAQGEPGFTNITSLGLATEVEWTNGASMFLLQRKLDLAADPAWVNVLTTTNGAAIVPQDAAAAFYRLQSGATNPVVPFSVLLNAQSEVPPTASAGTGIGLLSLDGSNLTYYIRFSGLSANATAAHIHAPATPTNNAGVLIPLSAPAATAGVMSGTLVLTPDQVTNIVNGQAYVNIHTSVNPGGEIRSQIVPLHIPIYLDGASQVPPVPTSATGWGTLTLVGSELYYHITYTNINGSAIQAHIHGPAGPNANFGVLETLAAPTGGSNGTVSGSIALTPTDLTFVLGGLTYINIHSTVYPGGEIRGQIWPIQLGANLAPSPLISSLGTGTAFMTIVSNRLTYTCTFTNLSSSATAAHIHGPAPPGGTGGVLIELPPPFATFGTMTGSTNLNSNQLFWIMTGQTYVNIHTINHPAGEIRGQLEPLN